MKTYSVRRLDSGGVSAEVVVMRAGNCGPQVTRYPLQHVVVHSPTGFEYGYGGSGPADLALSILFDWRGVRPDLGQWDDHLAGLAQAFKWEFIANADQLAPLEISDTQVFEWLRAQEREAVPS